jgi:hypothetical protein
VYQKPVVKGVPCSQETARDIIADLDSFNPDIRKRGSEKMAALREKATLYGEEVCVVEMQKVAKSLWPPERTVTASNAFLAFYGVVLLVLVVGVTFGWSYAPFAVLGLFVLAVTGALWKSVVN